MRRADRLFHLVQLLRTQRFTTAAQLADEMGVSARTVYRDVADLTSNGVPSEGEAGVGYRLMRGFELPPLTFNAEEIEALVLGMRMVEAWSDPSLAQAARSVVTKVEAVLPEPLRELLLRTALFAPGPWTEHAAQELGVLRAAIKEGTKVRVRYTRADGEGSERTLRPLGLYFWGNKWSLAAWCEMRTAYRNFRPDRMQTIERLDATFDGSDGIDLAGFIRQMQVDDEERGRV